jgi:RNA polymerase sigma-70 factor (ECF subfamily)
MTAIEFNYQITRLQDNLKAFAHSLTLNTEDAKDLMQETLLKALRYRDKFQDQTNLKAWMYTIMKNTFINEYRRRKRTDVIFDDTPENYFLNIGKNRGYVSPESVFSHKEMLNAVDELEPEYKTPFQRHVDGFKYKEIADELNLPIGTVKSRIFLARKKLMDMLPGYSAYAEASDFSGGDFAGDDE